MQLSIFNAPIISFEDSQWDNHDLFLTKPVFFPVDFILKCIELCTISMELTDPYIYNSSLREENKNNLIFNNFSINVEYYCINEILRKIQKTRTYNKSIFHDKTCLYNFLLCVKKTLLKSQKTIENEVKNSVEKYFLNLLTDDLKAWNLLFLFITYLNNIKLIHKRGFNSIEFVNMSEEYEIQRLYNDKKTLLKIEKDEIIKNNKFEELHNFIKDHRAILYATFDKLLKRGVSKEDMLNNFKNHEVFLNDNIKGLLFFDQLYINNIDAQFRYDVDFLSKIIYPIYSVCKIYDLSQEEKSVEKINNELFGGKQTIIKQWSDVMNGSSIHHSLFCIDRTPNLLLFTLIGKNDVQTALNRTLFNTIKVCIENMKQHEIKEDISMVSFFLPLLYLEYNEDSYIISKEFKKEIQKDVKLITLYRHLRQDSNGLKTDYMKYIILLNSIIIYNSLDNSDFCINHYLLFTIFYSNDKNKKLLHNLIDMNQDIENKLKQYYTLIYQPSDEELIESRFRLQTSKYKDTFISISKVQNNIHDSIPFCLFNDPNEFIFKMSDLSIIKYSDKKVDKNEKIFILVPNSSISSETLNSKKLIWGTKDIICAQYFKYLLSFHNREVYICIFTLNSDYKITLFTWRNLYIMYKCER
jgi:hypothetical protein